MDQKQLLKLMEQELKSKNIDVPSDLSSCAFIVATLINKNQI